MEMLILDSENGSVIIIKIANRVSQILHFEPSPPLPFSPKIA